MSDNFRPSRFTPSLMDPLDLEFLMVQREPLSARLVGQIRDSVLTPAKQHNLIVGPRGMGKTHLVAIVYHRLRALPELKGKAALCWLREDEWGINSFLEMLIRILRTGDNGASLVPAAELNQLFNLSAADATKTATRMLRDALQDRTLVLFLENLDEMFYSLGTKGQAQFRSFLQEKSCCTTLATTPAIFGGVSLHDSPFYGFFRIQALDKLSLDDAINQLKKIAERKGRDALAKFIDSPLGRARIRALHFLAGGNPRVYVIFSEFIENEQSLDDLVPSFLKTLDELTPYYQAKMQVLPAQQRQIVEFLCDNWPPSPVKEIARQCFMTQQTCSSQLRKLAENGLVKSEVLGRESRYQITEPLMRYCFALKKQRGEPVTLIIDVLRIWFTPEELIARIKSEIDQTDEARSYLIQALVARLDHDPVQMSAFEECLSAFESKDWVTAVKRAEELVAIENDFTNLSFLAQAEICAGQIDKGIAHIDEALSKPNRDPDTERNLRLMGAVGAVIGAMHQSALPLLDPLEDERLSPRLSARELKAWCHLALGNWIDASVAFKWAAVTSHHSAEMLLAAATALKLSGDEKAIHWLLDQFHSSQEFEALGQAAFELPEIASTKRLPSSTFEVLTHMQSELASELRPAPQWTAFRKGATKGMIAYFTRHPKSNTALAAESSFAAMTDGDPFRMALLRLVFHGQEPALDNFPEEQRNILQELSEYRTSAIAMASSSDTSAKKHLRSR